MEHFHIDAELLSSLHEASEEDLQALAELHEDPANDDQIELYIYLGFLIFLKSHNTQSLEQAIQRAEGWAAATAASHLDHDRRFSILSILVVWSHQYQAIEEVIEAVLSPVDSEEPATNETDIPNCLNDEAISQIETFKQTGRLECLNKAIENMELAISTAGEYVTPLILSNFGGMLQIRYERTGSIDDLNYAVSVSSKAVDATTYNDPGRGQRLNNLGLVLGIRFERTGLMDDLNQAISLINKAVDTTSDKLERAGRLSNLGAWLSVRFRWTGSIDDLNQAVSVASEAVDAIPQNHPDRATSLSNLGAWIGMRFKRTGSIDDLNQAVSITKEAVNATPNNHQSRAAYLNNLGSLLKARFEKKGSIDDLNQAISIVSEAADATPYGHLSRAIRLINLGFLLRNRYTQTGSIDDLDQAISIASEAANAIPNDHSDRAEYLYNLGQLLGTQYSRTELMEDLDRMLSSYTASWHCANSPPRQRIQSAYAAANILISQQKWEQSYQLLQEAASLLPTVSTRSLNHTDAQALLPDVFGLASSAAAAALNAGKAPEDALRLLELGRGVIAGSLMDMRGDITDLQQEYPNLAEKFSLLRDELDSPSHNAISATSADKVSSWELQMQRRREADKEFNQVIDTIRAQPGFSNFLQPPSVEELMSAAEQGPIIILNMSSFRCDAFLIQRSSIQAIELPDITQMGFLDQFTDDQVEPELSSLLEVLWNTICCPCLNELGIKNAVSDDNWPHIWWIPTGILSILPIHAAGIHKQGSKETVLDRAISSYASSIKALLHGRKHGIQEPRQPPLEDSALIVAMKETPGLGERGCLPFASDEVRMVQGLCPQLHLSPIMPLQQKEEILKHLPKCKLFHFAGHGQSDPSDPSQSCLLLEDWEKNPLTVREVRDSRLQDNPPFLAYLSACSTGSTRSAQLLDEGIHLISAFQLAGFRHVIGTFWEVSDKHCVDVARILYKTLQEEGMTDIAVSRGLHRAVRALRSGDAGDMQARDAKLACPRPAEQGVMDFFWVPYVHFGV